MILHLAYDEKVISRTIDYFEEALPGQNTFIILSKKKNGQYVKTDNPFVYFSKYNTKHFWHIVGDISQYHHIIYHFLWPEMVDFTLKTTPKCSITWMVWGADLYKYLLEPKGFQLYAYPEDIANTRSLLQKLRTPFSQLKAKYNLHRRIKAIKKITHVGILDTDLKLLKKYYPEFSHLKQKQFFYYPIDDILKNVSLQGELGHNIIVGNSASYTNNHRYVFEKLLNSDLGSRQVIVPLSYGAGKDYVINLGKILGERFHPITDFLPLEEYNKLLTSADTFIYGSFRQEAFGNILVALYLGGTVFLEERNPLYSECRNSGYIIFSMDQLSSKINYRLSEEEKQINRQLIHKNFNAELLLSYIKLSFGLENKCKS